MLILQIKSGLMILGLCDHTAVSYKLKFISTNVELFFNEECLEKDNYKNFFCLNIENLKQTIMEYF